jgi:hypothetical protein
VELHRVRSVLPREVDLVVGGAAADAVAGDPAPPGVRCCPSLVEWRAIVAAYRGAPAVRQRA